MNKMTMMMFALVAALATTGCSKKKASCDDIFEHTKALAPEGMREMIEAKKAKSIEKCESMSDEAKQCAMDAKSMEDLQKCPRS